MLGSAEYSAEIDAGSDVKMTYGSQAHGCHAAALRAVRFATELAGGDAGLEVGRDDLRGARKNAFFGGFWRIEGLGQHPLAHVQHWKAGAQLSQFSNYLDPFL